jgi:hypothetical protein
MSDLKQRSTNEFLKAKDLAVKISFENDETSEGKLRSKQARMIISELILLAKKRGRPSKKDEELNEAA